MPPEGIPFRKIVEEMETRLIGRALEAAGGVQKHAAELLQIKPTTLNEMIKRYGIRPRRKRAASGASPRARGGGALPNSAPRPMRSGMSAESASVAAAIEKVIGKRLTRVD